MTRAVKAEINPSASEFREAQRLFPNREGCISLRPMGPSLYDVRNGSASFGEVASVLPANRAILQNRLELLRRERFDRNNPAERSQYSDIIRRALNPNAPEAQELADYRMFELHNDVMAVPFTLSFFQSINLSADELPAILRPRPRNLQRFTVRTIGNDGGARQDQWRTFRQVDQLEMDFISTDRVEYPIRDIQQGNIPEVDDVNTELMYDMEMKIDSLGLTNILGAKAVSGLRSLLKIHPLIDTNNIPDSNYLNLTGTNAGVITIDKLKTILRLVLLWGAAGGAYEPVQINSVFISPQNVRDPWDFVNLTTNFLDNGGGPDITVRPVNTVPKEVRDSIFASGTFVSAWGNNFNWVQNAQISKGRMYIAYTQPLGWFFTKTEYDQQIRWEGPEEQDQNVGKMLWKRCLQFVVPNLWQYRVLIVDF